MLDQVVRRLAVLAVAPALLALAAPARADIPAPAAVSSATLMSQVVTMTNEQRAANGCNQLAVDRELTSASVRQSGYMARTGLFTHVWSDGTTFVARAYAAGYRQPSGENIAWGYDNAAQVMAAWMASPHHRENILNCDAKSIGTGVVYAATGIPYYTEVLGYE